MLLSQYAKALKQIRSPQPVCKSILDQIIAKHDPESLADDKTVEDSGKNPAAVALGRLGGKKGGKARAEKLSARKRSAIAKKAATARWGSKNARLFPKTRHFSACSFLWKATAFGVQNGFLAFIAIAFLNF